MIRRYFLSRTLRVARQRTLLRILRGKIRRRIRIAPRLGAFRCGRATGGGGFVMGGDSAEDAAPADDGERGGSSIADEASSARPTPRQQLFAETPAVVQERSAKIRAAEASAQASEERRRNATGAKRLADPSATGPPRL